MHAEYTGSPSRMQPIISSKFDADKQSSRHVEGVATVVRKKGKRQRRSTIRKDKKTLEAIRAYEEAMGTRPMPSSVRNQYPSSSTQTTPITTGRYTLPATVDDTLEPGNDNRPTKAWRYVTEVMKVSFFARSLTVALAFSLNLCPDFEARVAQKPSWLLDRIGYQLRRRINGERQVAFVVEEAHGRVHVHGVVEASSDEVDAVLDALRAAGGKWAATRGEKHQAHAKPIYDGDGWARYVTKQLATTRKVTGARRLVAMTRGGTQAATALYEALRKEMNAAAV